MSDVGQPVPPLLPNDDLVEQALERAANKVAAAAQSAPATQAASHQVGASMNRNESIIIVAVMTAVSVITLGFVIQIKGGLSSHARDLRKLCQTVAEQNPNTDPVAKAKAISACSD